MSTRFKTFALRAILGMASFVFISCEKSTGEIGLDQVINSQAVLGTKKTIPIKAFSVPFDSIRTSGPSREVVGRYVDPYLGGVDARFSTHLLLTLLNPDFGEDPICDSVVMFIGHNGYYGDTLVPVTLVVDEIDEYLDPDSNFYSNRNFLLGAELGRQTNRPRPRTIRLDQGDTISPAFKINLDKDYFQSKIFDAAVSNPEHFTDNGAFAEYMNGFQVRSDQHADGLLYFNVASLASYIKVYYRPTPADTVASFYEMIFGSVTTLSYASINTFEQDFSLGGPNFDSQDTVNGEPTIYSQAMGGASSQIMLPNVKEYKDSNWVINRAEIIIPVREGSVGKFPLPTSILMLEDDGETKQLIKDYDTQVNSQSVALGADGNLAIGQLREKSYTFNVTRLVTRLINTTDTIHPLLLVPVSSASNGWRAVLNGNTDPVNPMRFNIYYTKTKK